MEGDDGLGGVMRGLCLFHDFYARLCHGFQSSSCNHFCSSPLTSFDPVTKLETPIGITPARHDSDGLL